MAKAVRGPVGRGRSHPGSALSRAQAEDWGSGRAGELGREAGRAGERSLLVRRLPGCCSWVASVRHLESEPGGRNHTSASVTGAKPWP